MARHDHHQINDLAPDAERKIIADNILDNAGGWGNFCRQLGYDPSDTARSSPGNQRLETLVKLQYEKIRAERGRSDAGRHTGDVYKAG